MGNLRSYDDRTINAPNLLARFAHRHRMRRSIALAVERLGNGRLLDYGCSSGVFIKAMLGIRPGCAVGFEPIATDRTAPGLPIFRTLADAEKHGPFTIITLFETIEHLDDGYIDDFLGASRRLSSPGGGILMSAPIEIGPALFLKEMNRSGLRPPRSGYTLIELLKAGLLGVPARRAPDRLTSHRGFDFRRAVEHLRSKGWHASVLGYGPLPIGTWYGNSQVYLFAPRPD